MKENFDIFLIGMALLAAVVYAALQPPPKVRKSLPPQMKKTAPLRG